MANRVAFYTLIIQIGDWPSAAYERGMLLCVSQWEMQNPELFCALNSSLTVLGFIECQQYVESCTKVLLPPLPQGELSSTHDPTTMGIRMQGPAFERGKIFKLWPVAVKDRSGHGSPEEVRSVPSSRRRARLAESLQG